MQSRNGRGRGGPWAFAVPVLALSCALFLLPSLVAPLPALPASAQEPPPEGRTFSGRAQVTAVDLVIDVRNADGEVPADLRPEDFEVLEDGDPKPVIGVETFRRGSVAGRRAAEPAPQAAAPQERPEETAWTWSTVIYLDQVLSSTSSVRKSTQALAAQAGRLTSLGTVEVVVADPQPRAVLPPTRSARLVEQELLRLSRELSGRDAIRQLRRRFFELQRMQTELAGRGQGTTNSIADIPRNADVGVGRRESTWETLVQENGLLMEQQDRMLTWTMNHLGEPPRALLLVNDGYDLDPRDFYMSGTGNPRMLASLNSLMQTYSPLDRFNEMVRAMAAAGWVCVNMTLTDIGSSMAVAGAEVSGKGRMGIVSDSFGAGEVLELPSSLVMRPRDPLANLARETGGELVTAGAKIPAALERLGERVRLTYQVERLPDGTVHRVEVRAKRPGLQVKAPEWSGSPAPEAVATARARRLLEGGAERGDLPVVAALAMDAADTSSETRQGTLQARVDLAGFGGTLPAATGLRVTFAVELAEQLPFVRHDVVEAQQLAGLDAWTYTVPVSLPPEAGKVSVLVEELSTGAWGGAVAARVSGELAPPEEGRHVAGVQRGGKTKTAEELGYDLPVDLLPEPKTVVLLPPPGEAHTGRVRFDTLVTRADVERVEFRLDDERVALVGKAPFQAAVDVGALPEPRTVEAIAYDVEGEELGRDSVLLNAGAGSFRVRLIEPRRSDGGSVARLGPVDVEAEVHLRSGDALDRVEIAWNNELVATLYEPPFRQQVRVPPESPVGYVAVTAYLEDGSSAEDVIFLNGPGGDERVEVELVELFAVVTDPTGRPMEGLTASDFRVSEAGEVQELAEVRDGSELPLSLALLLDTSASMAESLQEVQIAAVDFLYLNLTPEDRAMLVAFDSRPRLVQPLTGDREALARKIVELEAGGYTALCDALAYSLVQMQEVEGRRALVVLSDGVGREERVGYATCLRLAQQVGVPIYAIVLDPDGEVRQDPERAGKVDDLTAAVGGRAFYVADLEELSGVYRTIRQEMRSQYLLTYYPRHAGRPGWRPVEVEVLQPGLTARTVSGYWP